MAESREAPFGHEPPGIATRRVVGVVLTLGTVVAIALVAIWLVLNYWVMPDYAQLHTQPGMLPPAPRLQPNHAHHDLAELRAEKAARLSGYAWTGKSHQFARIPIRRAMQIYIEEHAAGAQKQGPGTRNREPEGGAPAGSGRTGHAAGGGR